ncbi:MAG: DAK2 domain-containing protein [Clostridium sp.]|uniref:DAK2 domain protein n=1 Tax=Clostridium paraputrificum TaxID=29363 RepID=A0A6N2YRS5_9CLOT|nr:DAK2 domain-containing protein [Clostridium sp.]MBS5926073.1 DAK2 domain-containing protein [Clostridium sp.]MBS5985612.1 DAK2 domain-containing protein [Clostridium sp.]
MEYKSINGRDFYNMVVNASNRLAEESDFVNSLNVFPVPDGDTGTNMSMTFKAAVKEIENINSTSIGEVSKKLAKGALMGARGNSGVILSQILRGISKGLEGLEEADAAQIAVALKEGSNSAYKAVMRPTEGTILSVIRATAEAAIEIEATDVADLMDEATKAAKIMLDKTPDLLPALKKAKVVDSGGMGLYIILSGMTAALKEGIQAEVKDIKVSEGGAVGAKSTAEADIKFGYCTEFIILGDASNAKAFQDEIEPLGDSMIVVGYDDVIKVHIHTNDPGDVLAKAVKLGELSKIKIDNMREEHRELLMSEEEYANAEVEAHEEVAAEAKKYAFVTVAMGEGISNIFKDLGVDYVIEGGQTMNPSTQDILECVNKLNAEHIFILPNNKNIVMAANQASEISEKDVRVIPTTSIPQGITCVTMFNQEAEVDENEEELKELMKSVKTGSVTYAVRDTELEGSNQKVEAGNKLGLIEGKIKEVGADTYEVAEKVIENMVDEDSELITVFYGEDINEDEVNGFISKLEEKYDECDVQCYKGDQPLYYFFISVE